jgi:hypothetical protein
LDGHNIGVWYESTKKKKKKKKKWAVFNQDLAPVPTGSAFTVVVSPTDRGFVHRAAQENAVGKATCIDKPLLDGEPDVPALRRPDGSGAARFGRRPALLPMPPLPRPFTPPRRT